MAPGTPQSSTVTGLHLLSSATTPQNTEVDPETTKSSVQNRIDSFPNVASGSEYDIYSIQTLSRAASNATDPPLESNSF